ncbi:MAG: response regulator [Ktedonobacteraceae bacterium]
MQQPTHKNEQPLSHILVIDSEKAIIELLRSHLRPEDYQIDECQRSQEGVEMARRLQPDLIILALALSDIDGLELCRQLCTGRTRREPPVMALTHLDDAQIRLQAQKAGAEVNITRPFNKDELLWHIRALTKLRFHEPWGYAYLFKDDERLASWVRSQFAQGPLHLDTCPHCGAGILSGSNFCLTCGKFLASME